jgi:hypothetical protein
MVMVAPWHTVVTPESVAATGAGLIVSVSMAVALPQELVVV